MDDIYDWFRKLDDIDLSITFCAKNLRRVPRFNPEEAESTSMLERIIKLEESMIAQKGTHLALIGRTSKLEEKVFNGSESLEKQITQVNESLTKTDMKMVEMSNEVINIDKEIKSQKSSFSDTLKATLSKIKSTSNNTGVNGSSNNAYMSGSNLANLGNDNSQGAY